ncbi:hypothetical protein B7494_g2517 [Chlorociboria aeruginascens]|nr:hypothetical protein B7494_g2517 [Chlorociboria aeruginascens]
MVKLLKRMAKLRTLLAIRLGPGAAILPSEVRLIHMDFAMAGKDGHKGSRLFWRKYLPRMKYHNPAVSMTVNGTASLEGPALMTIHFTDPTSVVNVGSAVSSATDSTPSSISVVKPISGHSTIRTETIDMKNRQESEILERLMSITKAKPVNATPEEIDQLKDLEARRILSEKDAKINQIFREKKKRAETIFKQATGELTAKLEG